MALSMPVLRPATIPTAIKGQPNGAVDKSLLTWVEPNRTSLTWLMAELPARSMRALHVAVAKRGVTLTSTGRGRTLQQQYDLFVQRYQPATKTTYDNYLPERKKIWGDDDRNKVANLLGITIANSQYWVMKQTPTGLWPAMAAVPGTSNHGYWIADDLAKLVGGKVVSFNSADLQVLYELAPLHGFYWDTTKENWHVHWRNGDALTPATIAYEDSLKPPPEPEPEPEPIPPTPEPPVDSDLVITIYSLTDAHAVFIALTTGKGVALQVEWSGNGDDPKVQERIAEHLAAGATQATISVVDLENTTLVGPLPGLDGKHKWTGAEFFRYQRPDGTWSR